MRILSRIAELMFLHLRQNIIPDLSFLELSLVILHLFGIYVTLYITYKTTTILTEDMYTTIPSTPPTRQ